MSIKQEAIIREIVGLIVWMAVILGVIYGINGMVG